MNLDPAAPYFYALTVQFFEENGLAYKPLKDLKIQVGCPTWSNGCLSLPPNCEPGVIAHEMGHGAHECWRQTPRWGEDFANAVRYFVEERAGGTMDWCLIQKQSTSNIFLLMSQFEEALFVTLLSLGEETLERALRESVFDGHIDY